MKHLPSVAIFLAAFVISTALVNLVLVSTTSAADKPAPASTVQALMQQKLMSAHGLLDGIIREDYGMIQAQADRLHEISKATTWYKSDSEKFLSYAKSFQNATEYLSQQAKAKNMEGIAMGHVRVTLECMQCHNYVRAGREKN